jgi:CO dehydrogenase/acetyl-CoA synthase beta subunit
MIKIPYSITINWNIDKENVLESINKHSSGRIFKFCYHPLSGEFLMGAMPENHKEIVIEHGIHRFDNYVRGIYFADKMTVYLRWHDNEAYLNDTKAMLRENGVPEEIRIIWGEKAARELADDLRGL